MALSKGDKAPDFVLRTKTAEGLEDVRLSDNFGKKATVLLFFPLAFSDPCGKELCGIRDSLKEYESLDAVVYGISVDTPFSQEVFAKQNNFNFTLLSDFNKDVSASYDVLYEELLGFKGISKRSAFVIGKDGTILFSSVSEDPHVFPDFDAVKAALS